MRRPRMALVQQARKSLAFRGVLFHRRFEQRFLNVARHIAPYVHGSPSQQLGKVFVNHVDTLSAARQEELRPRASVP